MDASRATQRDDLVNKTREFFKGYLDESRDAGLKSNAFGDKFGNQYMPRVLDRDLYPDRSKAFGGGGGATSAVTGDMQARGKEFNVPGGTNTLTSLTEDESIWHLCLISQRMMQLLPARCISLFRRSKTN